MIVMRQRRLFINLAVFILILLIGATALAGLKSENWPVPKGLREYPVLRVIDGDTIEVGKLGKVRYIGVNTPETKHPSKPVEWMGEEAFKANRKLVEGKKVKLEFDAERYDKYGRVLAYVYVGTTFVNAWLVEAGYAQVMTVPPNVKYVQTFLQLERAARDAGRGLWGEKEDKDGGDSQEMYYASSKSDKFHYPWCVWAKKISPKNLIIFKSRKEALKAGYVPCKVCKP